MNVETPNAGSIRAADLLAAAARWVLAAVFVYMGATKALHPEEFLKLVRQYGVVQPLLLNLAAAMLPWFEIFCGLLLAAGVAVRGTALLLVAMLISFTTLISLRALEIQAPGTVAFCAIKFDCGCGAGVVPVCRKLSENVALTFLAVWLACSKQARLCLWHTVLPSPARSGQRPD